MPPPSAIAGAMQSVAAAAMADAHGGYRRTSFSHLHRSSFSHSHGAVTGQRTRGNTVTYVSVPDEQRTRPSTPPSSSTTLAMVATAQTGSSGSRRISSHTVDATDPGNNHSLSGLGHPPLRTQQRPQPTQTGSHIFPDQFIVRRSTLLIFPRRYKVAANFTSSRYLIRRLGWMKWEVVLHSGTRKSAPPLVRLRTRYLAQDSHLQLMVPPSSGEEPIKRRTYFVQKVSLSPSIYAWYSFIMEIESTGQLQLFQWRYTRDTRALQELGVSRWPFGKKGWELVWLKCADLRGIVGDSVGQTKENLLARQCECQFHEVVAAWSRPLYRIPSLQFRFFGPGADGSFGEQWAAMAFMTGLAIWDVCKRESHFRQATVEPPECIPSGPIDITNSTDLARQ